MTGPLRSVCQRLRVVIVAASALLLLAAASPASADDIYDIDMRLQEAGFDEAYTDAYDAADRTGLRIVIDYDSGSKDEAAYQREAEQAAELVWDHLNGRVLVVDVSSTFDVPWAEDGLPPAVSFDRAALTERFGARPAGLDGADVGTAGEEAGFVGLVVAGWLLSLVAVSAGTFFLMRARYRRAPAAVPPGYWGGWTGPPAPPAAWPPPAGWSPPAAGPAPAVAPVPSRPAPSPPVSTPASASASSAPAHQQPAEEPAQQAQHSPWGPLR